VTGVIPKGVPTPIAVLGLKPGELVRLKSAEQIAATLSVSNKNRGLSFDPEDLPYCGGIYHVRRQVTRIIDERSGRMLTMRTPCVSLEGVTARPFIARNACSARARSLPTGAKSTLNAWLRAALTMKGTRGHDPDFHVKREGSQWVRDQSLRAPLRCLLCRGE
jgi:hypothetical protein